MIEVVGRTALLVPRLPSADRCIPDVDYKWTDMDAVSRETLADFEQIVPPNYSPEEILFLEGMSDKSLALQNAAIRLAVHQISQECESLPELVVLDENDGNVFPGAMTHCETTFEGETNRIHTLIFSRHKTASLDQYEQFMGQLIPIINEELEQMQEPLIPFEVVEESE